MTGTLPHTELPARATRHGSLSETIALAREHVELRFGYAIELALLEPIDRDGEGTSARIGGARPRGQRWRTELISADETC